MLKPGNIIFRKTDLFKEEQLCLVVSVDTNYSVMLLAIPKFPFLQWDDYLDQFLNYEIYLPSVIKNQFSPYYATIGWYPHKVIDSWSIVP